MVLITGDLFSKVFKDAVTWKRRDI